MKSNPSQEKYLEVLRVLNITRRMIYRKMTHSLNNQLKKMFSKFSLDSEKNADELSEFISESKIAFGSFEPDYLVKSFQKNDNNIFDSCRNAEWRLLRFYEELLSNPRLSLDLRSTLSNQRDKVMVGYENLNLLSRYPW